MANSIIQDELRRQRTPVPVMAAPSALSYSDLAIPESGSPSMPYPDMPRIVSPNSVSTPAMNPVQQAQDRVTQLHMKGPGEAQLYHKISDSEFGKSHPLAGKILGGIAAGATGLGDIGLSTLGGGIGRLAATMTPGTILGHQAQLRGAEKGLTSAEANAEKEAQTSAIQSEAPLREAQTQEAQERVKEMPGIAAEREQLQDAQIANMLHPQAKTAFEAWRQKNPDTDPVEFLKAEASVKQQGEAPKTIQVQVSGKPHQMAWNAQTGKYDRDMGETGEKPPTVNVAALREHAGQDYVVPGPNGTHQLVRIYPGQQIPEGAQTQSGFNTMNTPTTQMRTSAGRAEVVVQMVPGILKEIDTLGPQMGPIMGRWNEFTQGKIGMDNPEFAGLRTDLVMLSTAVALAHAVGRLPENLREEFDHMINAPQQTPENVKTVINHVLPWIQKMAEQGSTTQQNRPSESNAPIKHFNPATGRLE